MSITPISAGASENEIVSENEIWATTTISTAQRTLDNIVYTMKREATKVFAERIQKAINNVSEQPTTSEIIAVSAYVKLLSKYEDEGAFCELHELSDRLHAAEMRASFKALSEETDVDIEEVS